MPFSLKKYRKVSIKINPDKYFLTIFSDFHLKSRIQMQ